MTKISIITINYNNLNGLKRTFASVVSQTCHEFEYIIIDGGSTDGGVEFIKENEIYLSYWVSEPDNGIYSAMNKGWKKAKGEYCLFLNSGDYLFSNYVLQNLFKRINKNIDVLYGDLQFVYNTHSRREIYPDKISIYNFVYSTVPHPSSLIRTSLLNDLGGYDESFNIISDWILFLRALIEKKIVFRKVDIIVTAFDMNGISNKKSNNDEKVAAFRKYFSYLEIDFEYFRELRYYQLSRIHQFFKNIISFLRN
jgi:glycosyltransferase involved in cell wall biosynthesis